MNQTYTNKYGKPQGNEMVYGKDIIRRIDIFEFNVVDRFKSSKEAHQTYKDWMKENHGLNIVPVTSDNNHWLDFRNILIDKNND